MSHLYYNSWVSLVRYCQTIISDARDAGLSSDLEYFDFDATSSVEDLPNKDLMGILGFGMETDLGMAYVNTALAVSTVNDDKYLTKHKKIISFLMDRLLPHQLVPLIDHTTSSEVGWLLVLEGMVVYPMERSSDRSYQQIDLEVSSSLPASGMAE